MVIEEFLTGPELSILAFSDGYTIVPLPAAQDHKRIGEGDSGPNTGGMGAYAPAPAATPQIMQQIVKQSLQPTIDGMRREGEAIAQIPSVECQIVFLRVSFCRTTVHGIYPDQRRPEGFRIQRTLRRPRN